MKKKEAQAELLKPKKTVTERERTFAMIAIPILILFFLFNTLPLIKGFIYSFTNFKGYGSYEWVGLRNYIDLFTDARVGKLLLSVTSSTTSSLTSFPPFSIRPASWPVAARRGSPS